MRARFLFVVAAAASISAFGQNTKDQIRDLQRDVAQMQDQIKTLQRSQDDKLATITAILQQTLDSANKANTAVAVLQSTINEKLSEQARTVGGAVNTTNGKVTEMADEFRGLRETIADLNSRMGKLDAKLVDLKTLVSTINVPAPTPTPAVTQPQVQPTAALPSSEKTYQDARRDYSAGKLELAMQEFQDYLKFFPQTEMAPNAQFYIGEIFLQGGDTDKAIQAYDAVLERYQENTKTPDARYMKAKALFQAGRRTDAQKEYCEVVKRYPDNDLAAKAKSTLKGMGYSGTCGVAPARTPVRKKR